jgi:5-methylcytosine-specific restriction endonuclease McrA
MISKEKRRRLDRKCSYMKEYYQKHPWKLLNNNLKLKYRELYEAGILKPISKKVYLETINLLEGLCYYCAKEMIFEKGCSPDKATIDHMLPITRGGTNDASNLVPACHACNSKKGIMTSEEYLDKKNDAATISSTGENNEEEKEDQEKAREVFKVICLNHPSGDQ